MDYEFEASTIEALAEIVKNNHISNGRKPVHWCIKCKSSLSDAEIEYREKISNAIDVLYTVENTSFISNLLKREIKQSIHFIIWTTTTWTLPASQAVCINPNISYVLIKTIHGKLEKILIFAKDLLPNLLNK